MQRNNSINNNYDFWLNLGNNQQIILKRCESIKRYEADLEALIGLDWKTQVAAMATEPAKKYAAAIAVGNDLELVAAAFILWGQYQQSFAVGSRLIVFESPSEEFIQ
jgi:hypothetical protein